MITQKRLKEVFEYCENGSFIEKNDRGKAKKGMVHLGYMMNWLKNITASLLISIFLTECANMTIKDFTACAIAPRESGVVCDGFLTNHQTILNQQEWLALSDGWIAVSPDDFRNLKIEIEQACSELKCSYEQKKAMQSFFQKVNSLKK